MKRFTKPTCIFLSSDDHIAEDEEHLVRRKYKIDYSSFKVNIDGLCVVYLKTGMLYMEKCNVRIRPLNISRGIKLTTVLALDNTKLKLLSCEIQGQITLSSVGVAVFNADASMSLCKIYNHIEGGIIIMNEVSYNVKITDCTFSDNKFCGIAINGPRTEPVIEKCIFTGNDGAGVICGKKTCPKVLRII
jgi:parallel beta-helix repeat protein